MFSVFRLFAILFLLCAAYQPAHAQIPWQIGNVLPGLCRRGESFLLTTSAAGAKLHICESPNNWVQQVTGAAAGVSSMAGTANQIAVSGATGEVVVSIPTNPTLPGTTTGTFSGPLTGNVTGNVSGSSGSTTGNAATATALAANGTNCSAGSYPLGVDANGNAENCTVDGGGGGTYTAGPSGALVLTGSAFDIDTAYVPGKTTSNTWTGVNSFAGATSTAPMKVGTTLPVTCAVGEAFFDSDATAGQNVYGCTATNTWTLQGGAGGTRYITLPFWTSNTGAGASPADATTYYAGCLARELETAAQSRPCYVPIASTLVAVYMGTYQFGAGSNETSTVSIRKNDTTDTTVCSTLDNSTARSVCNGTGLSVSYAAGDYFEIKWTTPTWATNPTALGMQGVALFSVN